MDRNQVRLNRFLLRLELAAATVFFSAAHRIRTLNLLTNVRVSLLGRN